MNKKGVLKILAHQFQNAIVYVLPAAGLASFLSGDGKDGFVISAILFLNAPLVFVQVYHSERALEALVSLGKHHDHKKGWKKPYIRTGSIGTRRCNCSQGK